MLARTVADSCYAYYSTFGISPTMCLSLEISWFSSCSAGANQDCFHDSLEVVMKQSCFR